MAPLAPEEVIRRKDLEIIKMRVRITVLEERISELESAEADRVLQLTPHPGLMTMRGSKNKNSKRA